MDYEIELWRKALEKELLDAGLTFGATEQCVARFVKLCDAASPQFSFATVFFANASVSESAKKRKVETIKSVIQKALEEYNRKHKGIDGNPVTRLREKIRRFNAPVDKCAVSIDGKSLTRDEIENVKIKEPSWIKSSVTFTANAADTTGKTRPLEMTVKF